MNSRIAAGILAIFATGLIVAPVETAARGGGFVGGGRAMPVVGGFRGPIVRPPIAPVRPMVAPAIRHAPLGHAPLARAPFARVPFARAPFGRVPFAHLRRGRFFSAGLPVSVWGDAPWYGGYIDPSYSYGAPPPDPAIYSYPATASPAADGGPVRERVIYVMPPRPGCSTQTYHVPAEKGGERSINVVRC
jgi:hypothetical protein